MICKKCKKRAANVHFKQVINGNVTKIDLCQDCAAKSGIGFSGMDMGGIFGSSIHFPSTSTQITELFNLLSQWPTKVPRSKPRPQKSCPQCHWTLDLFQKTGKMGCGICTSFFHKELSSVLKKIHGQITHKGKRLSAKSPKKKPEKRSIRKTGKATENILTLKTALAKAVQKENYEEAARLRDRIRDKEQKRS